MAQARINKKLKDKFRNEDVLRPVPRSPIARQNVTCHARSIILVIFHGRKIVYP
jgi:hypothetical protein